MYELQVRLRRHFCSPPARKIRQRRALSGADICASRAPKRILPAPDRRAGPPKTVCKRKSLPPFLRCRAKLPPTLCSCTPRNRRTAAECPNRPAADPCHTHRDGQFLRLVRCLGFGLYGLVERNRVSAGLYVQRRGDEGIVVDDLLPLAGQRAQYPLLRLRTL